MKRWGVLVFWDNFLSLCKEKKTTPTAVCVSLGLSNSIAVKWKRGTIPRNSTLKDIAEYFGVPLEYLLVGETAQAKPQITDEILKFALFGDDRAIPDELLQEVKRYAAYAKEKYFG